MSATVTDAVVVLVTGPDAETLARLGRDVVERRLAACANVLGGVSSVYRWEGEVQEESEALAIMKTTRERVAALEVAVRGLHPYEEPEFIVLPIEAGSGSYLEWVKESVHAGSEEELGE